MFLIQSQYYEKTSPWKKEMHTGLGCHFHSWWTVCVWRACRTSPSCRISYSIWCFRGKKLWGCGHVVGGSTSNSTIWLSLPSFSIVQIEMFGFAGLTRKNKENTFNQWWAGPTRGPQQTFFFYFFLFDFRIQVYSDPSVDLSFVLDQAKEPSVKIASLFLANLLTKPVE